MLWLAGLLMGVGVWLHLTEPKSWLHAERMTAYTHVHWHVHDAEHRHVHDFPWDGSEPRCHPHQHTLLRRGNRVYPDSRHQHT